MHRFKWIAAALALTALALPGSALAQGAAGDQYTEQIPSATGNNGSSPGGGEGSGAATGDGPESSGGSSGPESSGGSSGPESSGGSSGPVTSDTVDEFNKDEDGAAAAGLAQQTAPDSEALDNAAAKAQTGEAEEATSIFDSGDTSSSDGGMGIALPIILGVVLLGGIAYAWRRRRGSSGDGRTKPRGGLRDRLSSLSSRG